jgi:hypothetical protein
MKADERSSKPAEPKEGIDPVIFGEIQLLLPSIAVFALPLTVLSF